MKHHSFSVSHLLMFALTVGLLFAGAHASAQSKATVYIPFAFTANHQTMPAGHYSLELLSDRFLSFSDSRTGKHQAVIMVQPESGNYIETLGHLRFMATRDGHYLTEVRFAGSSMHSRPVESRSFAREIAKNLPSDSSIEIALNRK